MFAVVVGTEIKLFFSFFGFLNVIMYLIASDCHACKNHLSCLDLKFSSSVRDPTALSCLDQQELSYCLIRFAGELSEKKLSQIFFYQMIFLSA